ncbi:MAG: Crp/Fnr family transcriptional regulator [Bacteroidota bacterium]
MQSSDQTLFQQLVFSTQEFSPAIWEEFAAAWEPFACDRKVFLTRPGEVERYLYVVLEGVQRGYCLQGEREITAAFTYAPGYTGIPESFLSQQPSSFYLESLTPSRFLRISREALLRLCDEHHSVERWGRKIAEQVLIGMAHRQREILAFSAGEKVNAFMARSRHLLQLIPHKHVASYLGMQAETFSRHLRQWENES